MKTEVSKFSIGKQPWIYWHFQGFRLKWILSHTRCRNGSSWTWLVFMICCWLSCSWQQRRMIYLLFTEDLSKNKHPASLKGSQIKLKVVHHYTNMKNPGVSWDCSSVIPPCVHAPITSKNLLHLQPLRNPALLVFSRATIGHSKLAGTSFVNLLESKGLKTN